ncbi:hypothetical protein ACTXJF_13155 [Psychrobacter alimentarius]|uniref:hypothetical protein n=1 Tax=Psychrobacter alimentarius TaxID=261164 RepID=UPI003FD26937
MKKTLLLLVILALQACSDTTVQLPTDNVHKGSCINSKLETNTVQSFSDIDTGIDADIGKGIPTGIYFSNKNCGSDKTCKNFNPEKIDGKYFLSKNQDSNEATYYLLVKDNTYYLYSLQFLDEDYRAVGSWSQLKEIEESDLSFEIESIEQVMGSDYMGSYDNANINNALNTLANKSGLLEIGNLLEGNKIPTHETITFIHTNDGYKVDCKNYIKKYEEVADELFEKNMAVGFHFYYECSNGNVISFQDVKKLT